MNNTPLPIIFLHQHLQKQLKLIQEEAKKNQ